MVLVPSGPDDVSSLLSTGRRGLNSRAHIADVCCYASSVKPELAVFEIMICFYRLAVVMDAVVEGIKKYQRRIAEKTAFLSRRLEGESDRYFFSGHSDSG